LYIVFKLASQRSSPDYDRRHAPAKQPTGAPIEGIITPPILADWERPIHSGISDSQGRVYLPVPGRPDTGQL
jgi:hypothetical protein